MTSKQARVSEPLILENKQWLQPAVNNQTFQAASDTDASGQGGERCTAAQSSRGEHDVRHSEALPTTGASESCCVAVDSLPAAVTPSAAKVSLEAPASVSHSRGFGMPCQPQGVSSH